MITWITRSIAIGEFSDVVKDSLEQSIRNVQTMHESGITSVINMREVNDEIEQEAFMQAWHRGCFVRYFYCPVPIDCGDCTVYIANRGTCKTCEKNFLHPTEGNKFLQGLELAYYKLCEILYADYSQKVLLHCTAGMDRSPFVVAKYLCEKLKTLPEWNHNLGKMDFHFFRNMSEAYAFIKSKRPSICEHPEWIWWEQKNDMGRALETA